MVVRAAGNDPETFVFQCLRQHGGVTLRLVDLATDADLVEWAHEDARALAEADPALTRAQDRPLALEARGRFHEYFEELERA